MVNSNHTIHGRREFLTKIVPAAPALYFGCGHALMSFVPNAESQAPRNVHKFLTEMDRKVTYKQWIEQRHIKYIEILKHLEKDIGKGKLHEMLKKASYEENVKLGKRLSSRIQTLQVFAGPFRSETSGVGRTITREIVEDSETAFEMKITECLAEMVFREADALDLGYACICHADFGLPAGLNPKLKLVRTKTLMQGHDCCNHRYIDTGQ